jgi:two-component system, OmpR family, KDP operon response regulator KdpE
MFWRSIWRRVAVTAHRPELRLLAFASAAMVIEAAGESISDRDMSAIPLKILVVDDEQPIRKLLRIGFLAQGYEFLEAANGKIALRLLSQKPDLVILDLGLPDIDGFDLLQKIRVSHEALPIVVLSSRDDELTKVQALESGADDYVTKPFGMNELLARVRAALRHRLQVRSERNIFRTGDLTVDLVRISSKSGTGK